MDDQENKPDEDLSEEDRRRERIRQQFFSGTLSSAAPEEEAAEDKSTPEVKQPDRPEASSFPEDMKFMSGNPFGEPKRNKFVSVLLGIINFLVIIGIVVLIRTFVISPFSVVGNSMDDFFADGDLILIDKITFQLRSPARGDVVVFHPPINKFTNQNGLVCDLKKILWPILKISDAETACRSRDFFIKRVIGIAGDTVRIENGKVYVIPENGEETLIREDFLAERNQENTCFSVNCNSELDIRGMTVEVPKDAVFVLGDNRVGSSDSRMWKIGDKPAPFVPIENITGKVRVVFFPFSHLKLVPDIDLLSSPN